MESVDLGFAEERDGRWLANRYFCSKLGGKPAWLDLNILPTAQQLLCSKCQNPKVFVCQVNTKKTKSTQTIGFNEFIH